MAAVDVGGKHFYSFGVCSGKFRARACRSKNDVADQRGARGYESMAFCPNCGQENQGGDQFCAGCGIGLGGAAPTGEPIRSPAQRMLDVIPAGQGLRFANLIVDYIMQFVLGLVMGMAIVIIAGEAGSQILNTGLSWVFGVIISLIYYIVMESLFGRTIGKLVTGTKVVNELGDKASFGQILGRSFARLIPFEAFSFLGSTGRGWHDSLPKTYVIKCR